MADISESGRLGSPVLSAVIFDVDGTLADTERDGHRVAFNAAFAAHGIEIINRCRSGDRGGEYRLHR